MTEGEKFLLKLMAIVFLNIIVIAFISVIVIEKTSDYQQYCAMNSNLNATSKSITYNFVLDTDYIECCAKNGGIVIEDTNIIGVQTKKYVSTQVCDIIEYKEK